MYDEYIPEAREVLDKYSNKIIKNEYILRQVFSEHLSWLKPTIQNIDKLTNILDDSMAVCEIGCIKGLLGKYIMDIPKGYFGIEDGKNKIVQDTANDFNKGIMPFIDKKYIGTVDNLEVMNRCDTILFIWPIYHEKIAYEVLDNFISNIGNRKLIFVGDFRRVSINSFGFYKTLHALRKAKRVNIVKEKINAYSYMNENLYTVTKV